MLCQAKNDFLRIEVKESMAALQKMLKKFQDANFEVKMGLLRAQKEATDMRSRYQKESLQRKLLCAALHSSPSTKHTVAETSPS